MREVLILAGVPLIAGIAAYLSFLGRGWVGGVVWAVAFLSLVRLGPVVPPLVTIGAGMAGLGWVGAMVGRFVSPSPLTVAGGVYLVVFILVVLVWGAAPEDTF